MKVCQSPSTDKSKSCVRKCQTMLEAPKRRNPSKVGMSNPRGKQLLEGGSTTFPVGESRRVSNQMRFVCRILDAGDLHVYMCYIHGSTFWGWLKDCLQLIQRIRLSKNIIDSQGICQIRLFQAQKLAGQEKCKLNGKKETFQTGLSLHSITRKAALI